MARDQRNADRVELANAANELSKQRQQRMGMRTASRRVLILGVLFVVLLLFFGFLFPTFMFTNVNASNYTFSTFLDQMMSNLQGLVGVFTGNPEVFETRFMGALAVAVSGCALGLCGSTYQGAFNNPLAAPKTLGVMAGGALGAMVWVLGFSEAATPKIPWSGFVTQEQLSAVNMWLWEHHKLSWIVANYGESLCSVVGCFAVVAIVMALTSVIGRGHLSNILVIVCGQIIAVAVTGLITFARYVCTVGGSTDMAAELAEIENYVILDGFTYADIFIVILPLLVCIAIVLVLRNRLTLLSFGDDEAYSMGVNVNRTRYAMIAICTFMTAWAISFCGHIAFLGFISAQITRKIVGPDFRWLLPGSVFMGGSLVVIIMWVAQSGLPGTDPGATGTLCSIIGAAIFLVLAIREGRMVASARS